MPGKGWGPELQCLGFSWWKQVSHTIGWKSYGGVLKERLLKDIQTNIINVFGHRIWVPVLWAIPIYSNSADMLYNIRGSKGEMASAVVMVIFFYQIRPSMPPAPTLGMYPCGFTSSWVWCSRWLSYRIDILVVKNSFFFKHVACTHTYSPWPI